MSSLANMLSERRLVLRSGGARGADISFEKGVTLSEIFLTDHKRINGQISYYDPEMLKQASEIASKFHPVWGRLDEYSKKLHTRNTFQILGEELKTPSSFVICWTEDGKPKGGTAQAIRVATHYNIPIFNLGSPSGLDDFKCSYNLKIATDSLI